MSDGLEYRIAKVNVEPGDVLVLKTRREISQEQADRLREIMTRAVPGVKTIILTGDLELSVLTGAASPSRSPHDRHRGPALPQASEGRMSFMATLTIGELAAKHDLSLRALRFYEARGLLAPAREGRKRIYSQEDSQKLAVILDAAALGFTLSEIHGMVVKGPQGYSLALSSEAVAKQLNIMDGRLAETFEAVEKLRKLAQEKAA